LVGSYAPRVSSSLLLPSSVGYEATHLSLLAPRQVRTLFVSPPLTLQTNPNMFSFLAAFDLALWLTFLASMMAVAIVMWLYDKLSPYGHNSCPKGHPDRRRLRLSNSLLNSLAIATNRDGYAGRSWSTRATVIGFFFLAIILLSSFTATLAASLAVRNPSSFVLRSAEDVRSYSRLFV
jgi:hypothetical protein